MGLGFAVGLEHAFEPDHVAAVSTQISKSKFKQKSTKQLLKESFTKSSLLGMFWGAGHTTTLVLIGFLVYALAITIQDQIFSGLEFAVGMMLVFLGITTILNKKIKFRHKHPHQHKDGSLHFDEHNHDGTDHEHTHRSYFIGLVHGLAGSGSLVVLTAATLDNVGMILGVHCNIWNRLNDWNGSSWKHDGNSAGVWKQDKINPKEFPLCCRNIQSNHRFEYHVSNWFGWTFIWNLI